MSDATLITTAMATHLPAVNEPLNIFHLHDTICTKLSQAIQVSPGAIQHIPGVLYRLLVDVISLPCFGPGQHGMNIATDGSNFDGSSGKAIGKRVRA